MDEGASNRPGEARRRVIEKSMTDQGFRQRLLADPKTTIEEELGSKLPEEVEVRAVEETASIVYLVLPPKAESIQPGGELSDRELEAVAGGWISQGTAGESTCDQQPTCFRCGPRP